MATSVITGTIKTPAGTALSGVTVLARLKPYGFGSSGATELATQISTTTNASGVYTFTLERSADILPAGTYYEIEEQIPLANGGRRVWAITVGSANADIYDSLISTPPALTATTYLTQALADLRYQLLGSYLTATTGDARYPLLSLLTTTGDLAYATGASTWGRRAIGSTGDVLTVAGGVPTWAAPAAAATGTFVGCSARLTTDTNAPSNTYTTVPLNAEDFDTTAFHDNVTNNSRLTVPAGKAGYYLVSYDVAVYVDAAAPTYIEIGIAKNGSLQDAGHDAIDVPNTFTSYQRSGSGIINLAVGDYVTLLVDPYGQAVTINGVGPKTKLQVAYLGA